MKTPDGKHLVHVVTRIEGEYDDAVIGVWEEEKDITPALRNEIDYPEFDWCTDMRIEDAYVMGKDAKCEYAIARITRAVIL